MLREGSDVTRGILTGLLWGERGEGQARASLRQALSELKSALGEAASSSLLASKEAIAWAQGSAWIDVRLVQRAAGFDGRSGAARGCRTGWRRADEEPVHRRGGVRAVLAAERERFRLFARDIHARLME